MSAESETVKIVSWNVNGIRAGYKKGLLDWLADLSPDILCVQETKAHVEQLPKKLINPPGYFSYWSSAEKKGYSGVAVYSKKEPLEVTTSMGVDRFDSEGRVLRLQYEDFLLYNVYFPNGKKDSERLKYKLDFYEEFLAIITKDRERDPRVIVCGDVNTAHEEIDLARPKENEKSSGFLRIERDWLDKLASSGFADTFRSKYPDTVKYSWWDLKTRARARDVGWRIDYFFVTQELLPSISEAFILTEVMGSDHCPIGIDLALPRAT